jgi:hypothetical protein
VTTREAITLLDGAIEDDKPSIVNPGLTRRQAVKIMRDAIEGGILESPHVTAKRRLIERNVRWVAGDVR